MLIYHFSLALLSAIWPPTHPSGNKGDHTFMINLQKFFLLQFVFCRLFQQVVRFPLIKKKKSEVLLCFVMSFCYDTFPLFSVLFVY